ncbi:MAG: hypothetical protein PHU25_00370 [Deltaproteobacteria bacterium]|nr:hypothetical protein [Deltaproteobacteria bacterium]
MRRLTLIAIVVMAAGLAAGCGGAMAGKSTFKPGPMPEGGSFDGVWMTDFGRMELTETGGNVTGLYEGEMRYGRIEGHVNGDLLYFKWTQWDERLRGKPRETNGHGVYKYAIEQVKDHKKHKIVGEWGFGDSEVGNVWNGNKLTEGKKKLKPKEAGPAVMDDDYEASSGFEDGQKNMPTSPDEAGSLKEPEPEKKEQNNETVDSLFE